MRNIQHLCPSFSTIFINTYCTDVALFIDGSTVLSEEGTTQGDPLAMPMYALGVLPLIDCISGDLMQVWYADDATACGSLSELQLWWDKLIQFGPDFGYFPNPSKTCLVVKDSFYDAAVDLFQGSGISISADGKRHLGGVLGSPSFVSSFVRERVSTWTRELDLLSDISVTHPHAAYAAFTHGFIGKWNYLMRCIPNIEDFVAPLETIVRKHFLPNLTGQPSFNDTERKLFSLPARFGGLGVGDPSQYSTFQYSASVAITAPLVQLILRQSSAPPADVWCDQLEAKQHIVAEHHRSLTELRDGLLLLLSSSLHRSVLLSCESGSSSWLRALPLTEHGFALHKGAFRDALCLRYGWQPPLLPSNCVCGKKFTVEHALGCPCGGFPSIWHNELRDITAELLTEVCHCVGVESTLQPLTGEQFSYRSANVEVGVRLDVVAEGFWVRRQKAYFDVKVFNPFAPNYSSI